MNTVLSARRIADKRLEGVRYYIAISKRCLYLKGINADFGGGPLDVRRRFSSRSRFKLDALPFSVSPEEALQKFEIWSSREQGLDYLKGSVFIGAAYCPVWSFDVNIRFVAETSAGRKQILNWQPEWIASAYGRDQAVVHMPGLSVYSGYTYRRSLMNTVHNTTLVFMGDQTVPFGQWMLRDMRLSDGATIEVFPDPWNTTRGRALAVLKEELSSLAQDAPEERAKVEVEIVASRRVYLPTYVIDYSVLGVEYRAFVSGCDAAVEVSGESHKIVGISGDDARSAFTQAVGLAQRGAYVLGPRGIFVAAQVVLSILGRFLVRIPLIGLVAGTFVGFRKIIQPFFDRRTATAEWERQREHEAAMSDDATTASDFRDRGDALRFFLANRDSILRSLSGTQTHEKGDYDWYAEWEEWARRQWEQQQEQSSSYGGGGHRGRQQRRSKRKSVEYEWDFDPDDPYSVLNVRRGATKSEVSAAYRKLMLKYHPDTQSPNASEAERARAEERAKVINEAYRKLKTELK